MKTLKEYICESNDYKIDSYNKKVLKKINDLEKKYNKENDLTRSNKIYPIALNFIQKELPIIYKNIDELSSKMESSSTETDGWLYLYVGLSKKMKDIAKKCEILDYKNLQNIAILSEYNKTTKFNTFVQFYWGSDGETDLDWYHNTAVCSGTTCYVEDFEMFNSFKVILFVREILNYTYYRLINHIPDDVDDDTLKDSIKLKGDNFMKSLIGYNTGYRWNEKSQKSTKLVKEPIKEPIKEPKVKLPKLIKDFKLSLDSNKGQDIYNNLIKIVKKYGTKEYENEYRLRFTPIDRRWNNEITYMSYYKNNLWLNVYWQGDSTDGDELIKFVDVWNKGEVLVQGNSFFDGYRERKDHSDFTVTKDKVKKYLTKFIEEYNFDK